MKFRQKKNTFKEEEIWRNLWFWNRLRIICLYKSGWWRNKSSLECLYLAEVYEGLSPKTIGSSVPNFRWPIWGLCWYSLSKRQIYYPANPLSGRDIGEVVFACKVPLIPEACWTPIRICNSYMLASGARATFRCSDTDRVFMEGSASVCYRPLRPFGRRPFFQMAADSIQRRI